MPTLNDDTDNVYGVNNLNYLQQQLKGYDAETSKQENEITPTSQEADNSESTSQNEIGDGDGLSSSPGDNSTSSPNDEESSGDGSPDDSENKTDFIPIPTSTYDPPSTVATQLQRLSQIIKGLSSDGNQSSDLGPDDLNEFLTLQKIKSEKPATKESMSISSNARPFPSNGKINPNDLDQILDLQKRLNKLASTRDALSTPATPVGYTVTGSGYYPADATTVHINAATPMQNPSFPDPGFSSSQIVVNRPGGSVLFSLPFGNGQYGSQEQQQSPQPSAQPPKQENAISEETLKKLLDLSKLMSTTNHPVNIPGFITPTDATGFYGQQFVRPLFYNIPVSGVPMPFLANYDGKNAYNYLGGIDRMQTEDSKRPMEKIASVAGHIESDGLNVEHRPDDIGLSTVIHNHIPITISNPSSTHSTVHRPHGISTTARPYTDENNQQPQYDSYGFRRPNQQSEVGNYYPYPPLDPVTQDRVNSYDQQRPSPTPYNSGSVHGNQHFSTQDTPTHYVKISQSPPDEYPSYNPSIITAHQPLPTFSSDDSSYTTKFYTPTPHLSNHNVNQFVPVEQTYPTLRPNSFIPNRRPLFAPTLPTYMDHVTDYGLPALKTGSSERPFDDLSSEDVYGGEVPDDGASNQDSLEQLSNEGIDNSHVAHTNQQVLNLFSNYKNALTQSISSTVSSDGLTKANSVVSTSSSTNNNDQKPLFEYNPVQTEKHKQFVNLGGNFISLESYQDAIEPYLSSNSLLNTRIEVLTCATGVRQANTTDCTKYFVCNSNTGKVLSYSCPPYTAFNPDTKICNAKTYAECYPNSIKTKITIEDNKHKQHQLSLLQAQRIKNEALKAQQLAHLIRLETEKILDANKRRVGVGGKATLPPSTLPPNHRKKVPHRQTTHASTSADQTRKGGKRRIPCRTEGKLADNLSSTHYFLCFKDKDGKMRARRLLCPAQLNFCANTKVCTSTQRCGKSSSE